MRLAFVHPEIPQNAGAMIRLGACMGQNVDLIEPFGFLWSNYYLRRAGMDYAKKNPTPRYPSWDIYRNTFPKRRYVALAPQQGCCYTNYVFSPNDSLVVGCESKGLSPQILDSCEACVFIPLAPDCRSLNVVCALSFVLGEALRQTNCFP